MVRIQNCNIVELIMLSKKVEFYCFGSGKQADDFFEKYKVFHMENHVRGFIDNDEKKIGSYKIINGQKIRIYSFSQFVNRKNSDTVVLTTSKFFALMIEQMDKEEKLCDMPCYVDYWVENEYTEQAFIPTQGNIHKIPKVIHYCWFGKQKIPAAYQKYIDTWRKQCPDYEIVQWNEENYDISRCKYMKQAYDAGKWAFVSDYARLDIIYQYGGIYLDTDVELLQNLDRLLFDEMFCGFERNNYVAFGLGYGAIKGHPIIRNLLMRYQEMDFFAEDQVPCVAYQHSEIMKHGFQPRNEYQYCNGVALYPSEAFAPLDLYGIQSCVTDRTFSIHHYSSTWWEKDIQDDYKYIKENLQKFRNRLKTGGNKDDKHSI